MTTNFSIDFDGALFEFYTMNRVRLHLYYVYVEYEGAKRRFHMQLEEDGKFHITDKPVCPEVFHHLEDTLSEAIFRLGDLPNINIT